MAALGAEGNVYAYNPPPSLWSLIESQLPSHELDEVKTLLGESLVEQSKELYQEIEVLLDIWRECRHETEQQESTLMHNRLPEPPEVRERLKAEIKFFVESLREKAKRSGGDPERILSRQNSQVLDYVLDKGGSEGNSSRAGSSVRPMSAMSNGRETPALREPINASRSGRTSAVDDMLGRNVTLEKMESVTEHLREVLQEEVDFLLQDIEFLQGCLDAEMNTRSLLTSREPTLTDLREQRSQLERELLTSPSASRKTSSSEIHRKDSVRKRPDMRAVVTSPELSSEMKLFPNEPGISLQTLTLDTEESSNTSQPHLSVTALSRSRPMRPTKGPLTAKHASEMPSSIGALLQVAAPTHLTIRTGSLPPSAKLVKVGSIPAKSCVTTPEGVRVLQPNLLPKPPPSSKLSPAQVHRPGSAQRFRNMVLECRSDK